MKKKISGFVEFLLKEASRFQFSFLFFVFLTVRLYVESVSFDLKDIPRGMIGQSTLYGINVSTRANLLTHSIMIFSVAAFSISCIAFIFKRILLAREVGFINSLSAGGIVLLLSSVFHPSVYESVYLILLLQLLCVVMLLLRLFVFKNSPPREFEIKFLSVLVLTGWMYFFYSDFMNVCITQFSVPFYTLILICALLGILIFEFSFRNSSRTLQQKLNMISPMAWIPLLGLFSTELYLVLNQHGWFLFSPSIWYAIFFILLCVFCIVRKLRRKIESQSAKRILYYGWLPLLLAGIAQRIYYVPVIHPDSTIFDFEKANRVLPLLEWHQFGVVPLAEKFSSHALSDFGFGWLYDLLNGFSGKGFLIYDFLFPLTASLLVYYFLLLFFRNIWMALFFVLLSPILDKLLPEYFIYTVIPLIFLYRISSKKTKHWWWLASAVCFLILWRIDLGYSSLFATIVTMVIIFLLQQQKPVWKKFIPIFLIPGICLTIFIGIMIIKGVNAIDYIQNVLHYLSSGQSYGYISIGDTTLNSFRIQYFVFPIVVFCIPIVLVFQSKRIFVPATTRFAWLSLIYLSIFYLFNFPRGVVRHGFYEAVDVFLSSFVFIILAGTVYLFQKSWALEKKFMLFALCSFILVTAFGFPETKNMNNRISLFAQKKKEVVPVSDQKINRAEEDSSQISSESGALIEFLRTQLAPSQTFFDFTNTPMLYYYAQKPVPSYFYQNLLSVHDGFMQEKNIEQLGRYDVPVLVYSFNFSNWGDQVDDVPNAVRHYALAEYFFQNYHPAFLINNAQVWLRNDFSVSGNYPKDTSAANPKLYNLHLLPLLQAGEKMNFVQSLQPKDSAKNIYILDSLAQKTGSRYISFNVINHSSIPVELKMEFGNSNAVNGSFEFTVPDGEHECAIRVSTQYLWWTESNSWIRFTTVNGGSIERTTISKVILEKSE